ncbi:low affinity immunoglobulin gamma Fc region receptor II-like [Onychostruthus taczanowskii]|uniref:low affinity immunoglobulin gamma Fc region receptor II-like n=1 Tax=Onychostruthus taczanowskii TaxID=356909 RepID=UPI001B7FF5D3|nr:low affinity immunoglobulin gamma Fc region receptor II-like [Onychostruthus taczanowskii]
MAGRVTLLLWAQTFGLAGAQTTQLLVEPPWRPAVLWDPVTLTCQGSGTTGATTWYKDRQLWWPEGPDRLTVTEKGTYTCDRPGSGHSPSVRVSDDWLVLQVPVRALLEGDTVTLRCRGWRNYRVTEVSFYREGKELGGLRDGTELSLSPLQLSHSGRYRCKGRVGSWRREESAPVTVTVHVREGPGGVPVSPNATLRPPRCRRCPRRTPAVPPEAGEVLYTQVVPTARAAGSPGATPEVPQVTYAELPGPRWHPGDGGDYENVL